MNLDTPVSQIPYIGPTYVKKLQKLNIKTAEDLIHHCPFRYNDFSIISKITQVQLGETVTIQGKVLSVKNEYTKYGKQIQKTIISDETGNLEVVWYNQPFLVKVIPVGGNISLSGKVTSFGKKLVLESPEYELLKPATSYPASPCLALPRPASPAGRRQAGGRQAAGRQLPATIHTARLVPVYPETRGLSSKWLRSRIVFLLPKLLEQIKEYLPEEIVNYNHLLDIKSALSGIHFPKDKKQAKNARERLAFDELFFIQLSSALRKRQWRREVVSNKYQITDNRKQITEFYEKLPFKLTKAQRRAVGEILTDLGTDNPMNRLLQGDVGCGKTVVAAIAIYLTYLNGFQSALMAPTEILAFQHYETIKNLLEPFGLKIALLTSSKKQSKKQWNNGTMEQWNIIIGTHALLNEKLKFEKLGLVVIDEQHRFGVEQRAKLRQKGINPHILTMTATPIPRSVALTLYGELDLSYIDEMPPGRQGVQTWLVPLEKREAAYEWIKDEIKSQKSRLIGGQAPVKSQAFIICPLIQESEHETMQSVKAATVEYKRLQKKIFPDFKLGLLHGRLKGKEKDKVLQDFRDGKLDILIATPVVEVGIDIPNATIMLIEAAERFGLSQLHQLRGRVGRGERKSYCLLFTHSDNEKTLKRLKSMEKMYNGAKLAELDLKLRGPGEVFGTRQHGFLNLKIASLTDYDLIEKAKKAASVLIKKDATLTKFPLLKERIKKDTIRSVSQD